MPATFSGINTVLRGIEAEQIAMNVTSQNTANASTPGYSRQLVDMQTTAPISDPALQAAGPGQMGTGVQVASITRAHDGFVQQQIIYQNGHQSQLQTQSDTLRISQQSYRFIGADRGSPEWSESGERLQYGGGFAAHHAAAG